MNDKRKAIRVKYRCQSVLSLGNGISVNGEIQNLSLSGAYLTGGELPLFQVGDKCGFQIRLSGVDDNISVSGSAQIVRKKAQEAMAIHFLEVDPRGIEHLRKIIELKFSDTKKIDEELGTFLKGINPQGQKK